MSGCNGITDTSGLGGDDIVGGAGGEEGDAGDDGAGGDRRGEVRVTRGDGAGAGELERIVLRVERVVMVAGLDERALRLGGGEGDFGDAFRVRLAAWEEEFWTEEASALRLGGMVAVLR